MALAVMPISSRQGSNAVATVGIRPPLLLIPPSIVKANSIDFHAHYLKHNSVTPAGAAMFCH